MSNGLDTNRESTSPGNAAPPTSMPFTIDNVPVSDLHALADMVMTEFFSPVSAASQTPSVTDASLADQLRLNPFVDLLSDPSSADSLHEGELVSMTAPPQQSIRYDSSLRRRSQHVRDLEANRASQAQASDLLVDARALELRRLEGLFSNALLPKLELTRTNNFGRVSLDEHHSSAIDERLDGESTTNSSSSKTEPPRILNLHNSGIAKRTASTSKSAWKQSQVTQTKVRRYSQAKPSRFCHICARSADIVDLAPCRNVKYGVCRKSVCAKCFDENNWDWRRALATPSSFACPHCTKTCPLNAQCRTYGRTNERRRIVSMEKRKVIEDALAEGGDLEAALEKADFM
jgi:hypothetical protein